MVLGAGPQSFSPFSEKTRCLIHHPWNRSGDSLLSCHFTVHLISLTSNFDFVFVKIHWVSVWKKSGLLVPETHATSSGLLHPYLYHCCTEMPSSWLSIIFFHIFREAMTILLGTPPLFSSWTEVIGLSEYLMIERHISQFCWQQQPMVSV